MADGKVVSASFWPAPIEVFDKSSAQQAKYGDLEAAMVSTAKAVKEAKPQTIIVMSRYKFTLQDGVGYSPQAQLRGSVEDGAGNVYKIGMATDNLMNKAMIRQGNRIGVPLENILDSMPTISLKDYQLHHTAVIPLYYLAQAGLESCQIVRLTLGKLSYEDLYTLGLVVRNAAAAVGRRVAVVGSAELPAVGTTEYEKADNEVLSRCVMQSLKEQQLSYIQELGYPPKEEYACRAAAFLLGTISGCKAVSKELFNGVISDRYYGLTNFEFPL